METVIKRINELDKGLVTQLFQKANDSKNINPTTEFYSDAKNIMLVSYTDGIPSGFLWAYILSDVKTPYPAMLLYSIDVFSDFQRLGIATKLIDELKNLANVNGCRKMWVPTSKSNQPAMNLYEKTGGKAETDDGITFTYSRETLGS
ncbi:GNAT family N-acetyltransferase [Chloroflexota bacterium]